MSTTVDPTELIPRGYQEEMLEKSMRGNVIVVLETGSGKTLIAALRIKAELERCPRDRIVWLLSPGVELCKQQHSFLSRYLPAVRTRLLIGADNMDRWLEQRIWDAALDQVRLVVSTHDVLLQALEHAFVRISRLSLLVFDEAHHCMKKHPANKIMQNFYHPAKSQALSPVPHILGLSAGLVMKSSLTTMKVMETNLDSVAVTPRSYRQELFEHVNRPKCVVLPYTNSLSEEPTRGTALCALTRLTANGLSLSSDAQRFQQRAEYILVTLGVWSADCFVVKTIESMLDTSERPGSEYKEKTAGDTAALAAMAQQSSFRQTFEAGIHGLSFGLSAKASRLLEFLAEQSEASTKCLIFVERRDVAHVLGFLLNHHPTTSRLFQSAPFVGMSRHVSRRPGLGDLMDSKEQKDVLERFRANEVDVLVATNALEEGIDVQSCNLVICFDPPTNLKSFIQRRGRARQKKSTLALLAAAQDEGSKVLKWQALEAELLLLCQQDRQLSKETDPDEDDEEVDLSFVHPETRAMINADNALAHLQHFYSSLPPRPYVDHRPIFTYKMEPLQGEISASVMLPDCIAVASREIHSQHAWALEKAARKDAAFHAYKALFEAELLNDHLLPLTHDWSPAADFDELDHGQIEVSHQLEVWHTDCSSDVSTAWYRTSLVIRTGQPETPLISLALITSSELPRIATITIGRFTLEPCQIEFADSVRLLAVSPEDIRAYQKCTAVFFRSTRSYRLSLDLERLPVMLIPDDVSDLHGWLDLQTHQSNAEDAYQRGVALPFLLRAPLPNKPVFVAERWNTERSPPLTVSCSRVTRRHDPFHPHQQATERERASGDLLSFPARDCKVQAGSQSVVLASILLPPIFYHLSDTMTASRLRQDCLPHIPYHNLAYTMEAIRAPAANRENNYQRLEFLGDTVLKFVVSTYLYSAYPSWPEGYLSKRRGHLVCNERLATEALRLGLDTYIITDHSYHRDWTLPTEHGEPAAPRTLSTKILADVVEALIGATVVDTDMDMSVARDCISRLIPAIPPEARPFPEKPKISSERTEFLQEAEDLAGYTFKDRALLLEALTLSSTGSLITTQSYQRLEFLGDAVLDLLVMTTMLESQDPRRPLSQGEMTRIRAAVVNSHLLGFLCLRHHHSKDAETVITSASGEFEIESKSHTLTLWKFLRHGSADVTNAQIRCQQRYEESGPLIENALFHGAYPWLELAALRPEKLHSDIVESVIGAIFVDSGGNLEPCKAFVARIGLTDCIKRLVGDSIDVLHPRDQLQRLAGSEKVAFEVRQEADGTFSGTLVVGEEAIARVEACQTSEFAVLTLSIRGSEVLRQRKANGMPG